jgi:hypothetical protein
MLPSIIPQPANPTPEVGGKPRARILPFLNIIYILYSLEVGIALLCFPWLDIWENNYLLYLHPGIRPVIANPFFKGAVLGLGIANILIGIREIVHFKRVTRGFFSR